MGLLSASTSITRYKVEGKIKEPVIETITEGLKKNSINQADDDEPSDKIVGWTSFNDNFKPDFEGSSFLIGQFFIFSLSIEKKTIPSKVFKKHYSIEIAKRLAESGRDYLGKNEKQEVKQYIHDILSQRIPATPNSYDLLWDYEQESLCFFSTTKAANEELESLFLKSFKLNLIKLFPYTIAYIKSGLDEMGLDILSKLTPSKFIE